MAPDLVVQGQHLFETQAGEGAGERLLFLPETKSAGMSAW